MKKFAFAAMVAFVLVGCSSTPTTAPVEDKSATTDPAATAAAGGTTTRPAPGGVVTGSSTGATTGSAMLKDPNNILSKREVLFEFDSFVVADKYKPMVEAHARYLSGNRAAKVTVQGHGDERGAREYNIALGQRRADAVKRMMTLLGVQEIQIETVSFGEEKPRNLGHDEAAWTENRRVDIVYAGE